MRSECREPNLLPYSFRNLVKSANSERATRVTSRFREENLTEILAIVGSNERAAIAFNVLTDQVQGRGFDGNIPYAPVFRDLWTNGHDPLCPVDIINPQGHEFLSPKGSS